MHTSNSTVPGQRPQWGPALIKWAGLISVNIQTIATLSHYQYYHHIPRTRTRLWFSDHRSQTIRLVIESQRLRKRWITNRRNKISAVALTLINIKKLIHWSICWGVKRRMMNMMSGYRAGPIISHRLGVITELKRLGSNTQTVNVHRCLRLSSNVINSSLCNKRRK